MISYDKRKKREREEENARERESGMLLKRIVKEAEVAWVVVKI